MEMQVPFSLQKSLPPLKHLSGASPSKWIVLAAVSDYLLLVCWQSRRDGCSIAGQRRARYRAGAGLATAGDRAAQTAQLVFNSTVHWYSHLV